MKKWFAQKLTNLSAMTMRSGLFGLTIKLLGIASWLSPKQGYFMEDQDIPAKPKERLASTFVIPLQRGRAIVLRVPIRMPEEDFDLLISTLVLWKANLISSFQNESGK